ncbi:MutS-related protein [Streptomyces sp. NPDC004690]
MKTRLLHVDHDAMWDAEPPAQEDDLVRDLDLETLYTAMAGDDAFLHEHVHRVLMSPLTDPQAIRYRQDVLADCLARPDTVRDLYALATEAVTRERTVFGSFIRSPESSLSRSIDVLDLFVEMLRRLRCLGDTHGAEFRSEGFTRFFAMLADELGDDYFAAVHSHLERLRFKGGVLISARLTTGCKGTGYVLREPPHKRGWRDLFASSGPAAYTYHLPERDEAGAKALGELRGRGLDLAADALARSCDHILGFFAMLRAELAFYVGCLNLRDALAVKGAPVCRPDLAAPDAPALTCRGLYDVCLALRSDRPVVGSDVDADGALLLVVTGANEGGKSTFLRAVGLAHLMAQSGMFVAAGSFAADARDQVFTHFRREEDAGMVSGKLDEELERMNRIADRITARSIVLFNESFAATNEREGAEINRQILRALTEAGVKVVCVTHLYELSRGLYASPPHRAGTVFLRAERTPDGRRTHRLVQGAPEPTSYGADLYEQVFHTPARTAVHAPGPATTGEEPPDAVMGVE